MAFSHFHRHSKTYMLIFLVATLFSLFTFNVTGAILQSFAGLFGGTHGSAMRFKAANGAVVGLSQEEMDAAKRQVGGITRFNFDNGIAKEARDAWIPHLMLLADAHAAGIHIPDEVVDQQVESLKWRMQLQFQFSPDPELKKHVLTQAEFEMAIGNAGLTLESLTHRIREALEIDAYVRSLAGPDVPDPEQVIERFQTKNELVTLEYVVFSFDHFVQELHKSPPADAELEEWYKKLPAATVNLEYTRDERFSIDLATLDADAWDPAKADPALFTGVAEPTDDQYLSEAIRDPIRYAGGKAPEKAADLDAAARARIAKDRKLKVLVDKARAEFEEAAKKLPAPPEQKPDATDEEKTAAEAAKTANNAEEHRLFGEIAAKYGFTLTHHDDLEPKQLDEVDPPKTSTLQFLVRGLPTTKTIRASSALPSRDVKHAFLVRVDAHKGRETKPFAEVKEKVLGKWIDEHAREKAIEAATGFLDGVVAEGRKTVPADRFAAVDAERDENLKKVADDKDLAEESRKVRVAAEHEGWTDHVQSIVGPTVSTSFPDAAKAQGLTVKTLGPQRRSVKDTPWFRDRFQGAERFLWSQGSGPNDGGRRLLGYAPGMLSNVLVDDDGKACYVARVVARTRPKAEEMTPADRDDAERENQAWLRQRRSIPYQNPFSYSALIRSHEPEYLTAANHGPAADYDY